MKAARKLEVVELQEKWQFPVSISKYNRSSYLTKSEKEEIKYVVNKKSKWHSKTHKILERLLQPLNDAFDVVKPSSTTRLSLIKVLLCEINKRQTTFWDWKEEDWVQIISYSDSTFSKVYKVPKDTRNHLVAIVYLLFNFDSHRPGGVGLRTYSVATKVFGEELVNQACDRISEAYLSLGYGRDRAKVRLKGAICDLLLANRSPYLEDLTVDILKNLREKDKLPDYIRVDLLPTSCALASLGIIAEPLSPKIKQGERFGTNDATKNVPSSWLQWCQRWHNTSTLAPKTRLGSYYQLLKVGRWLNQKYPSITTPSQWTRELAINFISEVNRMRIGEYVENTNTNVNEIGKPLSPRGKSQLIGALRRFLKDCQEWEWIPRYFSPERVLVTPRSIQALIKPNPRVIADDIWAKLLWAGLNLTEKDLPISQYQDSINRTYWYPIEMVQAVTITWLFAGIRRNEICRLRVGCVRWQKDNIIIPGTNEVVPKDAVCYLEIPVNKTSPGYTKPVDRALGEAIEAWEKNRPPQPPLIDKKDGDYCDFLFMYRGRKLGEAYINKTIIPMLCKKAGIPDKDAKGNITSHRARSTIATQLSTAKDPMTLFELKEWLGHADINSTINYTKITPTKLAKSYQDAEYFKRNIRTVEVLIDKDAISNGAATNGELWKYFDLGHGLCTYDFFSQCTHRMACAGCGFYIPKNSSKAQIIEAKGNLERMLQEIPLTEEEQFAIEEGIEALTKLKEKLANTPTPSGQTPKQLEEERENA